MLKLIPVQQCLSMGAKIISLSLYSWYAITHLRMHVPKHIHTHMHCASMHAQTLHHALPNYAHRHTHGHTQRMHTDANTLDYNLAHVNLIKRNTITYMIGPLISDACCIIISTVVVVAIPLSTGGSGVGGAT